MHDVIFSTIYRNEKKYLFNSILFRRFDYFQRVKKIVFFLLILVLAGCSLNAEQEASLNRAIHRHLSAMNEGRMLQFVSEVHPAAVRYYKEKGDDVFKTHFSLSDSTDIYNADYYQDPLIEEIESDGDRIQVRYKVLRIDVDDFNPESEDVEIFALSEDNGVSWIFLHDQDYFIDEIFPPKQRLIKGK